ncbi:acyl-CoA-binding domain-containing protein 4 isoform X1 [Vombatus ursinus]|nr:acyl-CoA-binding domain-containing protein 4 isoform X1 [Vombatus ursinus]XP_027729174.1 acyl-CoA-binding domain-containing protein 4 isoform X1 [Vombatus ursinus]XP_027729175.1 acyl-CoA-binding domain-containing protein 4 isoform X1 [Vombatus ursinus]XP_027729176.1 acyl-CoA-binding domain-containing protein 4 isoform X1 [Vombatus ursinus]
MGTERQCSEPDCQKQFYAAVTVIQSLPKNGSYRPSYEEMLRFYSYYKQATQGPCHMPRPGFWDPIGRYKWDAWHSLGRMSQEEAMAAYIAEMKVVAQKVIDTVPLGEVDDGMFDYFVPLYEMIPDMPQPPETFLKKLTARKKKMRTVFEPLPPPEEPAPQTSAQLPRVPSVHGRASMDLDSEVFCDSLEQLEPEQDEWLQEELKEALEGETDISSDHLLPREREMVGRAPPGPQEFEAWLASTVRALQESMQDVQGRLRHLENLPRPAQNPPSQQGPWALELSTPTLLLLLLWPFVVQWLYRQFRRQKR